MDEGKIRKIIDGKNEQRESEALQMAATIIEEIAGAQKAIADSERRIAGLRAELAALEVEQINPASILG